VVSDEAEANRVAGRGRAGRPGRVHRWPSVRTPRRPQASPELVETVGLALALTEPGEQTDSPLPADEALRRLRAARDEFVGLVSHELRTPVTTIYGNARLMLDHQDACGVEVRQMLTDIVQDAERLLAIVENLLLLTRSGSGAPDDPEPLQLAHVLRAACRSFESRRGRRVQFDGPVDPRLLVEADRSHLELLLENLLSNADKFSLPDRPIEVQLRSKDGEAVVTVLDRGVGLGGQTAADLFAPFYRGPVARRVTGGMGLGLTVMQRVVDALGGRVWARPRQGGGAEIGFSLPLLPDPGA
jgi:signal transduction histidine kinase